MNVNSNRLSKGREKHLKQWNYLQSAWKNGRMPHAMLFVDPLYCALTGFIEQLTQLIFCKKKEDSPCHTCPDCQMVMRGEHPDMQWIKPEKIGGPIKIDQIRELHNNAYLTSQRAKHRLIVIEAADRMNAAAANSLLKILEEPPQHLLFILIAQQISTVLPTVLSRCQVMRFMSYDDLSMSHLLQMAEHYSPESDQAMILKQPEFILDGLIAVIEKKEHPCIVAAQWRQYDFSTLLWFLYLAYAQIQIMQINVSVPAGQTMSQLEHLASLLSPITIFAQIDKINILQRKLSHNMNVNQTLAFEDLLLAL